MWCQAKFSNPASAIWATYIPGELCKLLKAGLTSHIVRSDIILVLCEDASAILDITRWLL